MTIETMIWVAFLCGIYRQQLLQFVFGNRKGLTAHDHANLFQESFVQYGVAKISKIYVLQLQSNCIW